MHGTRVAIVAVFVGLLAAPGPASAQSLTVQNNATLTIQKDLTVNGTLTAESGTTLEIDNANGVSLTNSVDVAGTLALTSGALTPNGNLTLASSSETSVAAIAGSGSGSVSGDVTYERHLAKSDNASHFRMLGAPTSTALDDEGGTNPSHALLSNMWTQATGSGADAQVGSASNASVFDYNEGADLNGSALSTAWEDVQNLDNSISPGDGFLAFLFDDRDPDDGTTEGFPETLTATGAVQAEENDGTAVTPTITFTGNDSQSEDGWNLIANPFMAPIDWESIENDGNDLSNVPNKIYVYDAANGAYAIYQAGGSGTNGTKSGTGTQGRYIAPFQAFFVKATGSSPSIGSIDSGDKAVGQSPSVKSAPSGEESPHVTLRLRAEGDSTGERTVFRYTENAAAGKDAYDAYQLQPPAAEYALVASEMGGTESLFDIQSRPVPTEADTIDLALDVTEGGTYTLGAGALKNLPSDWRVILKNMDLGARYDLGAGETATFDHAASASAKTSPSTSIKAMLQEGRPTVAKAKSGGLLPSFRLFVGPKAALPVE